MSIEEIIREVSQIKMSSSQLTVTMSAASQGLSKNNNAMAAMVRGSRTGQEAVSAVSQAVGSLNKAAEVIRTLGKACEDCIAQISK